MTTADLENDPLVVFAEPYNTLILDGKSFKSPIPEIQGLAPKSNIRAWVDRKAFIHNMGHATAAYYGHFLHPDYVYLYQVLDDKKVFDFTREAMRQSADILLGAYPEDFTPKDLESHIDDLLHRFRNRALKDTVFRVGQDLPRKLGSDDRFMGAIHLAVNSKKPYDKILEAMAYGFFFDANDDSDHPSSSDLSFLRMVDQNFENTLIDKCGYDGLIDCPIVVKLGQMVNRLRIF